MKKSLFTIDGFEGIFEGYTQGQHWNGWACPYFTKEVAETIMNANNKYADEDFKMSYNADTDTFVRPYDEDENEEFQGIDIDGIHLYPIGTMCWIWDDLADYQTPQGKMLIEYLREEYGWLNCEQLHHCYYGILGEINGYMTDKEVQIFTDGFMAAYEWED